MNPKNVEAYFNLGVSYSRKNLFNLSISNYEKALEIAPNNPQIYNNLGIVYNKINQNDKAIENYNKAIELNPNNFEAYSNLGHTYSKKRLFDLSINSYEKAIKIKPDLANAYSDLSVVYLIQGNFLTGLEFFELRFFKTNANVCTTKLPTPKWNGAPIKDKTIYVYHEQGYGDTIMFSRYLPVLESMGAKVLFKPQKELESLFKDNNMKAEIISSDIPDETIKFDEHIPLMSLLRVLRVNLGNISSSEGYLKANAEKEKFSKEKYFNNNKYKIGIFWHGDPAHINDANRSIPLKYFNSFAGLDNVELYSLQKGTGIEQLKELSDSVKIIDIGSDFNDYSDTAAAIANLDLVITVDTSVAHLSAAMNKPTWILLPHFPDWRWLLDREDSPWYKSVKLFRQNEPGNWEELFIRVYNELKLKMLEK